MPKNDQSLSHQRGVLAEVRRKRGLTQQEAAELLGTTRINVSRWERGTTIPTPYFRSKLIKVYGKTLEELGFLPAELTQAENLAPKNQNRVDNLELPFAHFAHQSLVGRAALVEELVQTLCTHFSPYAITGIPGIGKTALVTALACHPTIQQHFRDGILWVGLGPKPHLLELLNQWGKQLGLTSNDMGDLTSIDAYARKLHHQLHNRTMLLIIDDAWELPAAITFRLGGPRCVHLLTTRFPAIALPFAYEHVTQLVELSLDESFDLLHCLVSPHASTSLYQQELRHLAELTGGHPLALTLIGRYLRVQAFRGQPRYLQNALKQLRSNVETRLLLGEPRVPWETASSHPIGMLVSLQTTIDLSVHHLSTPAQHLLSALAIFPSKPQTFSEEAALFVGGCQLDLFDHLLDYGLVEHAGPGRYFLHQTIADYARLQQDAVSTDISTKRFIEFFFHFILVHADHCDELDGDLHNITMAFELADERGLYAAFLTSMLIFMSFLETRRIYSLANTLLKRAQSAAKMVADQESEVLCSLHLGLIAELQGDLSHAEQYYQAGLALAEHVNNPTLEVRLLMQLGSIVGDQGNFLRSERLLRQALKRLQGQPSSPQLYFVLRNLGEAIDSLGRHEEASQYYQQALALAQQAGDGNEISAILQNLGVKAALHGDYLQAASYYEKGLQAAKACQNVQRQSALLMNMGMLAFSLQDLPQAIQHSLASLALARQIDHRIRIASVLQNLGILEGENNNHERAEAYFQESFEVAQVACDDWLICETQIAWANLLLKQQQLSVAEPLLNRALAAAKRMQAPQLEAQALFGLAQFEALQGNNGQAIVYAHASHVLFVILKQQEQYKVEDWLCDLERDVPLHGVVQMPDKKR